MDQKWQEQPTEVNINTEDDVLYVDDTRAFINPIRPGGWWSEEPWSSNHQQEPLEWSPLWKRGVQNVQTIRRQEGGL